MRIDLSFQVSVFIVQILLAQELFTVDGFSPNNIEEDDWAYKYRDWELFYCAGKLNLKQSSKEAGCVISFDEVEDVDPKTDYRQRDYEGDEYK